MPILDHFHPPLSGQRMWNAFHHAWATTMARHLNRHVLPDVYFAAPNVQFGARVDIDVWLYPLRTGARLPSVPLFLRADVCVVLPLEDTYVETCQDQRITLDQTAPC